MLGSVSKDILHSSIKKIVKYSGFKKVLLCAAYDLEFTLWSSDDKGSDNETG